MTPKATAIVGIGASAGGITAFREFFENMPADTSMAFVVILHLPSGRRSMLAEILGRWTAMPVVDAEDGMEPQPAHVYVPPSDTVAELGAGRLHLRRVQWEPGREHTPIDIFFDSLAAEQGDDAIGIVLSGTGSDGTLGLKVIRKRGGLTLAQGGGAAAGAADSGGPRQPQFNGMPDGAIATGVVDVVLPASEMPAYLVGVQKLRQAAREDPTTQAEQDRLRLDICGVLRTQLGHDFSQYKERTFMRRVQRRMQVLGLADMAAFADRLRADRRESVLLFRDLLISVTSFFRDAATFAVLEETVIPGLFEGREPDATLRVWVAGCATGEEAYSLCILLREHMATLASSPPVQVFATDIDEPAIATARAGRYTASLMEGVSPERQKRFFSRSGGGYVVAKEVRDMCTFSAHSLTRDPPFSRIDLISCRNLLIYLDADLQERVVPAFHYSLAPGGILLLGSSETTSRHAELFDPVDQRHRIFRRIDRASPPLNLDGRVQRQFEPTIRPGAVRDQDTMRLRAAEEAGARVLQQFAPAFLVVNAGGDIMHYSSRTGAYLEAPQGGPSRNMIDQARRGLALELGVALRAAVQSGRRVERPGLSFVSEGDTRRSVSVVVEPMRDVGAIKPYLVIFIDAGRVAETTPANAESGPPDASDAHVEQELRQTREQLYEVMEEHETVLEELRSAIEELNSLNEEMQSTNEELETSKEEIQSVNEELQTVNAQLSFKVEELDRTNSDIRNLFESTQVATIFLDPHLVVRGFTPAIAGIYNLIPADHGRPLTDIASRLRYDTLRDDVEHVLQTLAPLERRVARVDDNAHYLMRILPYRAPDSRVDGTLITFVDVTSIVLAEQHQRMLVDELNHRVKNMLTVVISLVAQTLRRATSLEDFSATFMGRVESLTAAYALLSRDNWSGVSLHEVLQEGLKPYMARDRSNIAMAGPAVTMEPRGALALGMAVHELATNAVKHGALSYPGRAGRHQLAGGPGRRRANPAPGMGRKRRPAGHPADPPRLRHDPDRAQPAARSERRRRHRVQPRRRARLVARDPAAAEQRDDGDRRRVPRPRRRRNNGVTHSDLNGCRVMIVEDELLVAMLMEDTLIDQGCEVVGPFARLDDAMRAAETELLDLAVLDVNVAGRNVYPVAEMLVSRDIPFLLVSGYGQDAVPINRPNWVACAKPFMPNQLTTMLIRQLNRR